MEEETCQVNRFDAGMDLLSKPADWPERLGVTEAEKHRPTVYIAIIQD